MIAVPPAQRTNASVATWSCIVGTFLTAIAASTGMTWLHYVTPWVTGFFIWYAPFIQMRALVWHYNTMIKRMRQELSSSGLSSAGRRRISEKLKIMEEILFELQMALLPTEEHIKRYALEIAEVEKVREKILEAGEKAPSS